MAKENWNKTHCTTLSYEPGQYNSSRKALTCLSPENHLKTAMTKQEWQRSKEKSEKKIIAERTSKIWITSGLVLLLFGTVSVVVSAVSVVLDNGKQSRETRETKEITVQPFSWCASAFSFLSFSSSESSSRFLFSCAGGSLCPFFSFQNGQPLTLSLLRSLLFPFGFLGSTVLWVKLNCERWPRKFKRTRLTCMQNKRRLPSFCSHFFSNCVHFHCFWVFLVILIRASRDWGSSFPTLPDMSSLSTSSCGASAGREPSPLRQDPSWFYFMFIPCWSRFLCFCSWQISGAVSAPTCVISSLMVYRSLLSLVGTSMQDFLKLEKNFLRRIPRRRAEVFRNAKNNSQSRWSSVISLILSSLLLESRIMMSFGLVSCDFPWRVMASVLDHLRCCSLLCRVFFCSSGSVLHLLTDAQVDIFCRRIFALLRPRRLFFWKNPWHASEAWQSSLEFQGLLAYSKITWLLVDFTVWLCQCGCRRRTSPSTNGQRAESNLVVFRFCKPSSKL